MVVSHKITNGVACGLVLADIKDAAFAQKNIGPAIRGPKAKAVPIIIANSPAQALAGLKNHSDHSPRIDA